MTPEAEVPRECPECIRLDAVASRASADPRQPDRSALLDVRIMRERHAPACPASRG